MMKLLYSAVAIALVISLAIAGGTRKKPGFEAIPDEGRPVDANAPIRSVPDPDWSAMTSAVGTFTTLTGFYDYQSNGGAIQHIRVNPANGNIHVTYMIATDSTAAGLNNSRRTGYAFSSNNGTTWNNFSNVHVPARRSGFPTIDLLRGPNAGYPAIANHNDPGGGLRTMVYVDAPEGTGAFSELSSTPLLQGGTDEPIWPYIAGASDGSITIATSRSAAANAWYTRTADLVSWSPYTQITQVTQSGGRYPVQANGTGRVGQLYNTSNGTAALGNWWTESTNNGSTWSTPTNIFPFRSVTSGTRVDTFNSYVHADFVYNGNTPLFAFTEYATAPDRDDVNIVFWSQATGFRVAVPFDSTKYFFDPMNQRFHAFNLGWPSIGLSGTTNPTIVIAYQAFQADTDSRGYRYSDLWYVASTNGGNTWGAPQRITNTRTVDERYPSVSKFNAAGQFNMVWGQKNRSGLYAFPGNADTVRSSQVFLRVSPIVVTDVKQVGPGVANSFALSQNYPNPFNPATKIDYTVARSGPVSIKVYNTLGQQVATLLDENLAPGEYQVTFDGAHLPSGVYVYTMRAGSFSESKKFVLMK